jgi:2-dehydropantoate 2-reductase
VARIAIIGPGAVGGVIAAWLDSTGKHEVVLCARRHFEELRVEVEGRELIARVAVLTNPADAKPVDWVLVTTKAYDVQGAATWLPALTRTGAPVAVLQNGVEHVERFAPYVSPDTIVPVMVDCPAERTAVNHIRQRGRGKMIVTDNSRGREFAALFAGTALDVSLTGDFRTAVWRKLCLNVAGAISALVLKPAGVMHDQQLGAIAVEMVKECVAVGRAEGAKLDDTIPEAVLTSYRQAPPDSVNSLHADRAAGRPMEVDARNGVVARLGRKHGIATPYNDMAVALLAASNLP